MSRTPNYVLTTEVSIGTGPYDKKVLEAGSFVRPIEYCYLPKHITEDSKFKFWNKDKEVFVYCRYGIILIFRDQMRQV